MPNILKNYYKNEIKKAISIKINYFIFLKFNFKEFKRYLKNFGIFYKKLKEKSKIVCKYL
jgi:hypothetical protein